MVEAAADVFRQSRIADGLRPVKQQIVVVENVLPLFGFDIGREQLLQLRRPPGTPRKRLAQHLLDFGLRVHASGVDGKASALGGKATFGLGESQFVSRQIHQISGILAVMDREGGVQTNLIGIVAQKSGSDAVKGTGPGQRLGHDAGVVAHDLARNPLDAACHLACGAARECHHQNAARVGAVDDQMGDPMCQRIGLSGSRAGNDQQRRSWRAIIAQHAVLDRLPLLNVEGVEIARGGHD